MNSDWMKSLYLWGLLTGSSTESGWQRWADTAQGTLPLLPASRSCSPACCRRVWSHRSVSPAGCHLGSPRCSQWRLRFWGSRWGHGAGLWKPRPHHERKHSQTGWPQPSGRCQLQLGSYLRERVCKGRDKHIILKGSPGVWICRFAWNMSNVAWAARLSASAPVT